MITEFQKSWEQEYKIKTSEQLQSVIDKRNTRNEQNVKTQRDRETAADMDEVRADGDDDDEVGSSEDDHGEDEDGAVTGGWDSLALQTETGVQQVPLDTDPLMWWKQHVQEFPRPARMSRQDLAVPATSASPERLFSSVGLVKSDLRGRLLDSTLIDVMWVKQAP